MRILILCEGHLGYSGLQTYVRMLAAGLRGKGHDVILCSSGDDADHRALHAGMAYLSRPWARWIDAWRIWRVARSVRPDIIHATFEPYALALMLLPKTWASRCVVTFHGSYGAWLCKKPAFVRWVGRRGVSCIAVSQYTKRRCIEEGGPGIRKRISVVYTGMVLPPYTERPGNAVPSVLLVGGVKARKGVKEAIAAVAAYAEEHGPVRFTAVGTCEDRHPYVREARAMVATAGLESAVTFAGRIDDAELAALYHTADLYLMPSQTTPDRFEGFGLVFLEAGAHGLPCIGPADGGAAEAIIDGVTGYRIDTADTAGIVRAMRNVLKEKTIDPRACREHAERFTVAAMADGTEEAYAAAGR